MEIDKTEIDKSTTVLVGFNGESTSAIGKIKLTVFTAGGKQDDHRFGHWLSTSI